MSDLRTRLLVARTLTHGASRRGKWTPEYRAYVNAKRRCNNKKDISYALYGGRGVRFLFPSFERFFAEVGRRPKGKTLDRKDTTKAYAPGNVRWATPKQQANNRRKRRWWKKPLELCV